MTFSDGFWFATGQAVGGLLIAVPIGAAVFAVMLWLSRREDSRLASGGSGTAAGDVRPYGAGHAGAVDPATSNPRTEGA
jgi:hypothetical protein